LRSEGSAQNTTASKTFGQSDASSPSHFIQVASQYVASPNITYLTVQNYSAKLDLYRPGDTSAVPVVIWIHGGGWVAGSKEEVLLATLPYMEMGFAVINVEYRLAKISPAPAAVEDCLCVLHWLGRHADEYHLDLNKVVISGASAGGHLALTTAVLPTSTDLDSSCANDDDPSGGAGPWPNRRVNIAAVVNWFGITDVADLIHQDARAYAITWLGAAEDRDRIAKRVSPITYVRAGLPPILTIHGDRDTYVPYQQARRFHEALTKVGVQNRLITIEGKGHGDFTLEENMRIWKEIKQFLSQIGITPVPN
jgi:acetyl esterase/lipase